MIFFSMGQHRSEQGGGSRGNGALTVFLRMIYSSHLWEALAQQLIRLLLTYGANGGKSIVGLKKSEEDHEIVVSCEFETEKITNLKCGEDLKWYIIG